MSQSRQGHALTEMKMFKATLSGTSLRAEDFKAVFGTLDVPVKNFQPVQADLPGLQGKDIYLLDVESLTTEQMDKLVDHVADKFGIRNKAGIRNEIKTNGFPILADDINIVIDPRMIL